MYLNIGRFNKLRREQWQKSDDGLWPSEKAEYSKVVYYWDEKLSLSFQRVFARVVESNRVGIGIL